MSLSQAFQSVKIFFCNMCMKLSVSEVSAGVETSPHCLYSFIKGLTISIFLASFFFPNSSWRVDYHIPPVPVPQPPPSSHTNTQRRAAGPLCQPTAQEQRVPKTLPLPPPLPPYPMWIRPRDPAATHSVHLPQGGWVRGVWRDTADGRQGSATCRPPSFTPRRQDAERHRPRRKTPTPTSPPPSESSRFFPSVTSHSFMSRVLSNVVHHDIERQNLFLSCTLFLSAANNKLWQKTHDIMLQDEHSTGETLTLVHYIKCASYSFIF